jgi:uncharacterized protein involved in exopolysaccharide biosynthesis
MTVRVAPSEASFRTLRRRSASIGLRLRLQVEQLRQQLREQLARELQGIAEAEKQRADAEKQIADLERQLSLQRQNSTTSSKARSCDGLAGKQHRNDAGGRRASEK